MRLTDNFGGGSSGSASARPKTITECTPFQAGWGIAWAFVVVGAIVGLVCGIVLWFVRIY
jgi:hypothetical protein